MRRRAQARSGGCGFMAFGMRRAGWLGRAGGAGGGARARRAAVFGLGGRRGRFLRRAQGLRGQIGLNLGEHLGGLLGVVVFVGALFDAVLLELVVAVGRDAVAADLFTTFEPGAT